MKRILFFSALIFTSVLSAQPDIKGGECFLGLTDPGNGNGIAFTVTDGNWDEVVEDIILNESLLKMFKLKKIKNFILEIL